MKHLTVILILHLSIGCLHAQTNLDSLWNTWHDEHLEDSIRVKAYFHYIWRGFVFSNPDSAIVLANDLYNFSSNRNHSKGKALALNALGVANVIKGDNLKAYRSFMSSMEISEAIGDRQGVAGSLNSLGNLYWRQGLHTKALEHFQQSLKIVEELGRQSGIATALNNIGLIYAQTQDNNNALKYFQKGLQIKEAINDKRGVASAYNNIGLLYHEEKNYRKAQEYLERSLQLREELDDNSGVAASLNNLGLLFQDQGNYEGALAQFQRSLSVSRLTRYKIGINSSLRYVGQAYNLIADHRNAVKLCSEALQGASEIGAIDIQRDACQCLYNAYKALENGKEALHYHEQMLTLDDSLQSQETSKKLQQMEFQKQMLADSMANEEAKVKAQMAYEADVRNKKRSRNLFLGGGLFVLLLAAGLYSRNRYIRKSRDEISKEKDRSENLLLNILPAEIAEELKEKGRADARNFEMVSILFTDFKEFTQTSEKLSAQELVEEINVCFEAFDAICEKYGIEKIKTIGDAYMAAGGLPIPDEAAAENTVMAALEMQQFMVQRSKELVKEGKQGFQMRAGIHTGPVVAGIVGVKKFQYDIWGDTVNTASRMESHGEVGKVNISQDTYDLIKNDPKFAFEPRGNVEVKGKGEVEMYYVYRNS